MKAAAHNFDAAQPEVYGALVTAVTEAGYVVKALDRESGVVAFTTGMSWKSWAGQAMTATVVPGGPDQCTVLIGGKRAGYRFGKPIQAYDWGEKNSIASKLFAGIEQQLSHRAILSL
jgi:hypothetical protein